MRPHPNGRLPAARRIRRGRRYAPDGVHVRRWAEELADVKGALVHEPWNLPAQERARTVPLPEGLDPFKRARGAPEVRRDDVRRAAGHPARHLVRVSRHTRIARKVPRP
ncbi:FAD-binding domain-containing protein [Streptomyces sp. NBC_01788]|nr:FAD-binding domain-containing protein [Streptomyces sp. NBC_01788]